MRLPALAGLAAGLVLLPQPLLAHGAVTGAGGFYGGLLHPLSVPAHVLILLGVGLFLGQRAESAELPLLAFALALLAGLFLSGTKLVAAPPATWLLALAAGVGLLVVLARPLPPWALVLPALAAGLGIGLDSAPDTPLGAGWSSDLGGVWLGACALLLLASLLGSGAPTAWRRIGVRVLGSWTAASALLVLALSLRR